MAAGRRSDLEVVFWKALLVAGVLWFLYLNIGFVLMTLVALMIAAAIMPLADAAEARRVPRLVTVSLVYVAALAILTLLVALLVPVVVEQGQIIARNVPVYREGLNGWLQRLARTFNRTWGERIRIPEVGLEQVAPVAQELLRRSMALTRGVFSGAVAGFLILFVAGYIVADRRRIGAGLSQFVPRDRRAEAGMLSIMVLRRMGGYIRGQAIVSVFVALMLTFGLWILGFETALLIGVIAGTLNFIPWLGSFITMVVSILIALNMSPLTVIGVLLLFSVEQFVEGNILVPYFLGKQVDLHPLAVMAALLVGANLAGLIGALVSVPILAGVNALVQETYVKKVQH